MLYQTDLYLAPFDDSELQSDAAVKIHGAVMNSIPAKCAEMLHEQSYHPLSVFAVSTPQGYIIRVSALNDEAKAVTDSLETMSEIKVYGCNSNQPIQIIQHNTAPAVTSECLGEYVSEKGCRIDFVTPAMVKSNGRPTAKPDICSYFYSVMMKYNEFEQKELSFSDVQTAFQAAQYGAYQLSSTQYNISGRIFPGMIGFCELSFHKDKGLTRLLRKMIAYASYCGVGAKTAQGMGGVVIRNM